MTSIDYVSASLLLLRLHPYTPFSFPLGELLPWGGDLWHGHRNHSPLSQYLVASAEKAYPESSTKTSLSVLIGAHKTILNWPLGGYFIEGNVYLLVNVVISRPHQAEEKVWVIVCTRINLPPFHSTTSDCSSHYLSFRLTTESISDLWRESSSFLVSCDFLIFVPLP